MGEHVCNPSIQETETGGLLQVHAQPGLHGEFQASQGYHSKTLLQTSQSTNKHPLHDITHCSLYDTNTKA